MKTLNTLALVALFALASCQKESSQKDPSTPLQINDFSEITAPDGFDFNATKSVSLNFSVDNPGYQQAYTIEVYDQSPEAGGDLIFKGFTKNDHLSSEVMVASSLKRVFVVKKDPTGASVTEMVEVNGNSINHAFVKKSAGKKTVVVSPDCSTGCTQTVNTSGWFNINSAGTYCINGYNGVQGINDNNGNAVIRICGNVTISGNISIQNNTELQVTDGATLNVQGINMNGTGGKITVFTTGTLNVTGQNFNSHGAVVNHGTINITKEAAFYKPLTNNGSLHVKGTGYSNANSPGPLVNNGLMVVDGFFTQNSTNTITNNCKLHVKKNFQMNATVENNSYILVDQNYSSNGNAILTFTDGAMLDIKGNASGYLNGDMNGIGTPSVVKVAGGINSNSTAAFTGNLEFCIGGTASLHASTLVAPAAFACGNTYIPTSTCNPAGNGTPTVADVDGDNVPDASDLFPNDPERAGEMYFPGKNSFGTIAFEDLWPAMGDYDFNDLVLDYRARLVMDANNKIKDIEISYKVRAIGAGYRNGFGLEINVPASAVQSVTRSTALGNLISLNANGTEAGQSKAVLILFDKATDELPNPGSAFVNTLPGAPYSTPKVSQAMVTFTNAQSAQVINMNPFIFVNQDRSREIHMPYTSPTDLADASMFGTGVDDSNPASGRYYVTKNNQPWVIVLPTSFDYPSEKIDIVHAYNNFASWALSGGSSHTDWYANTAGYRNAASIY